MRVAVIVRSVALGGAELQAAVTAIELERRGHDVALVTFHADSTLEALARSGVEHILLDTPTWTVPTALAHRLRRWGPEVLYGFLAGPNLLASAACAVVGDPAVVWGVRSTSLRLVDETRLGRAVNRLEPLLSGTPDLVIANSFAGREAARNRGFRADHFEVVPNGIEMPRATALSPQARVRARRSLGVGADGFVIGRVGRVHPMKDLVTLFRAAAALPELDPPVTLVVVGPDGGAYAESLRHSWGDRAGFARIKWIGPEPDMSSVYPAFDLAVSSSAYGEGFPNVVAESMAHGVLTIGTDVGDTARVIDDPTLVVHAEHPVELSEVMWRTITMASAVRRDRAEAQRRSIRRFSVEELGRRTEGLLTELLEQRS